MATFKKDDFKGMTYYVWGNGDLMVRLYPDLGRIDAFVNPPDTVAGIPSWQPTKQDLDMLLRFVILFVDPYKNPLTEIRDFDERKKMVAQVLGIHATDATYVWRLANNNLPWFLQLVHKYFVLIHNLDYEDWFTSKMVWHELSEMLVRPSVDADSAEQKTNLMKSREIIKKRLQDLESRLFKDERMKEVITKQSVTDNKDWAEKYADKYVTPKTEFQYK